MADDTLLQTAVEARQRSRSVTKDDYLYGKGEVINWILPHYGGWGMRNNTLPEYLPTHDPSNFFNSRDRVLLSTPKHEAQWANALAIATTQIAAWDWAVESDIPLRRKRAQQVLQNSTAGIFVGMVPLLTAHLRGFLTTGIGVVEIERETSAYSSRVKALHHLNPLRCRLTDDPKFPVLYIDKHSQVHKLPFHDVLLFGDQIDPSLGEIDGPESAAVRAYRKIALMAAIDKYIYEKVTGKRPLAIHFIQGLTETRLQEGIASTQHDRERNGGGIYMGAAAVPVPGDIPVNIVSIPLAEMPDGFDPQNLRDDAYIAYANAIGLDVNDIDPRLAQRQSLGSGAQALILDRKSKGKGLTAWRKQWIENLNQWALDTSTKFVFSDRNVDDETKQAQLSKARMDAIKGMLDAQLITPEQARNLLVDMEELPRDFLDTDMPGGNKLDGEDKEQPGKDKPGTPQNPPQDGAKQPPPTNDKPGKETAVAQGKPAENGKPAAQGKQAKIAQKEAIDRLKTAVQFLPVLPVPKNEAGETAVKHLQGKHNQQMHGYRFNSMPSATQRRKLHKAGLLTDYTDRARQRQGKAPKWGDKPDIWGQEDVDSGHATPGAATAEARHSKWVGAKINRDKKKLEQLRKRSADAKKRAELEAEERKKRAQDNKLEDKRNVISNHMKKAGNGNPEARVSVNDSELKTLENYERSIRKQNYESASIVDKDGSVLLQVRGGENYVSFSDDEAEMMRGKIVTHNHPSSSPFSDADIAMLSAHGVKQIRAIGRDGTLYTLSIDPKSRFTRMTYEDVYNAISHINDNVYAEFYGLINAGKMTYQEAESKHNYYRMELFMKEFGNDFYYEAIAP